MRVEESKTVPAPVSLGRRVMYGAMGSAAAVGSILAGSCLSRCNGCMGCLAGGAGIVGILAGSKMVEKISGAKWRTTPESEDETRTR
ncbi:MAG TPA: hypothetical protein DET40_15255 [Lentisphaeria bacterium]|nr:MAG: hypothetical protein A2X45_05225 [Lentisphaerae bacterium GWF2_50_93]HCE44897.1 hypothetical protein [Lentisphaeria bacterium]